jgi:hypothetical protein
MNIEKKIRFNNKDWCVQIEGMDVFVYDNEEKNKVIGNQIYGSCCQGETLIEVCKNAVLRANDIIAKSYDYENFIKWDGDMDKELKR